MNHQELASLADIVQEKIPAHLDQAAIRFDNGETYDTISFRQYLANAVMMIRFLHGLSGGQKVIGTFTLNRPEWDATALATFYTGNILFPLDTSLNEAELEHLLSIDPPDFMLVSAVQLPRIGSVLRRVSARTRLILADLYRVFEDTKHAAAADSADAISMAALAPERSPGEPSAPSSLLEDRDTVLAHYATSGTVNLSSIVQLTHGNIVAGVNEGLEVLTIRENEDFLNIGPYTHIATLVEFLAAKTRCRTVTYFTREVDEKGVLENAIRMLKRQGVRIKALMAVPKFWVHILKEVLEEIKGTSAFGNLYRYLIAVEKNERVQELGTLDKAKLTAARTLLRERMGGYFGYGISSSTKLDPGVIEIFARLGITLIDIYGATETTGIIARNFLNESRSGSCGKLIDSLQGRLKNVSRVPGFPFPVGELELKGPTIAKGYLEESGRTRAFTSDEGFFPTGDLAFLDKDNWVYLVGRRKELIRWNDGSYIDPMRLSNLLTRSIYIKDALVTRLGENDHLSAFVLPDYERIRKDAEYLERRKAGMEERQVLRILLDGAIEYAQSLAAMTAPISRDRIYLLERKLERTPTHKIKLLFELQRLNLDNWI
jgi:long-chain acyl-CoA synthetase